MNCQWHSLSGKLGSLREGALERGLGAKAVELGGEHLLMNVGLKPKIPKELLEDVIRVSEMKRVASECSGPSEAT